MWMSAAVTSTVAAVFVARQLRPCGVTHRSSCDAPATPVAPEELARTVGRSRARRLAICSGASAVRSMRRRLTRSTRSKAKDETGFSVSYDVDEPRRHANGARRSVPKRRPRWSCPASCGDSATTSRPSITCRRGRSIAGEQDRGARARRASGRSCRTLERLEEYWRWADNPFLGAREFRGMLVVLLMLNSTDLKDDNNSIYDLEGAVGRRRALVRRPRPRRGARRDRQAVSAPQLARRLREAAASSRASATAAIEFDYRRPPSGTADDDRAG